MTQNQSQPTSGQKQPTSSTGKDQLEFQKLEYEIREASSWRWKTFAPYFSILVMVIGLMITWTHQQDADRLQRDSELHQRQIESSRLENERMADREQALHFQEQLQEARREADGTREQTEHHQLQERFQVAVAQLGSTQTMQRVAAVYAVGEFSKSPEFEERAASALAASLEVETDPSTEQALVKAFEVSSPVIIASLVRANIEAQAQFARSFGRYVGIEMARKFPGEIDEWPSPEKDKAHSDYERMAIIGDPVQAVYYHRRPVEEVVSHEFIRDAFWIQSFPDTMSELFHSEENWEWHSPAKDYQSAKQNALEGIRHSVRYLELTSTILEHLLHMNSGHVSNWKLNGVYFVVADLRKLDMRGIDLSGSYLQMADLRGADLSNSRCLNTDFDGVNFSEAKLVRTKLAGAILKSDQPFPSDGPHGPNHTLVSPVSPEDPRFRDADFTSATWRQAKVISAPFRAYLQAHF